MFVAMEVEHALFDQLMNIAERLRNMQTKSSSLVHF
jgi:hypothetical protein